MTENPLYVRSRQLLDAAADVLADRAPERRFVTIGQPAWDTSLEDCVEQLTVNLTLRMDQQRAMRAVILKPIFSVVLVRCVTGLTRDGKIPSAEILDDEAVALYDDAQILVDGIIGKWNASPQTLFPGAAIDAVQFGDLTAQGPSGGLAGWRWDLALSPLQ